MSFTSVFEEQSLREMVRLLATVIVYFDVTKMSQRRHSSDFSFTSGYISECWNSSRSCTTLMRFESDHLKKAVALLRKPVKEVLGTEILEFVKDRGPGKWIGTSSRCLKRILEPIVRLHRNHDVTCYINSSYVPP